MKKEPTTVKRLVIIWIRSVDSMVLMVSMS